MSYIKVFDATNPTAPLRETADQKEMATILAEIGVRFEQWEASADVAPGASQEEIIAAYKTDIDRLIAEQGYQTVDVVSLTADNPNKEQFRQKFLNEHIHSEDEVRFFVGGSGLFTMHTSGRIFEVLCEKGDLISVPANTKHWFDMGPNPNFACIRLFNDPAGWVANFTGSDIAEKFSRLEN